MQLKGVRWWSQKGGCQWRDMASTGSTNLSSTKLQTLAFYITLGSLHYCLFKILPGLFCPFLSSLHFVLTALTGLLSHMPSLHVFEMRVLKICQCQEHKDYNNNKNHANQRTIPLFGSLRAVFIFIYLLFKKEETNQSNLSFFFFLNVFPCSLHFFCSSNNLGRFCFESSEVNSGGQAP